MKTICFLIIAAVFPVLVKSQSADLVMKLELNKVYRVKNITNQNTTQTVMGSEQSSQTTSTSILALKPLKQLENEMIAEIRFDTIHTVISQPPMDINSANPGDINSSDPGKVMECILHRMANSTFLVKMTNTGRVVEFINLDPVIAGILQGVDSLKGPTGDFLKDRAKMLVEEKALKSMVEMTTVYLPGSNVKVGENWEINTQVYGGGMGMIQNATYKLISVDENTGIISAEVLTESAPGTMEMNGMLITPDIRGIGKVELTIDSKTGWIQKGEFKQQLKGDVLVNAQGNNLTIPTEINTTGQFIALP